MPFHSQHYVFWLDITMHVTLEMDKRVELKNHDVRLFDRTYPLMKESKPKNKFCCVEGSPILIKSSTLKFYVSNLPS